MATGIVVPPAHAVPHRVGERIRVKGFELTEHFFTVPLDHFAAESETPETLEVFVREVVAASKVSDPTFDRASMPALLFLQGGPGFEAARPIEANGWLAEATESFRVFLLDQRGTGRSTRVTNESLQRKFGDIANDQLATTNASKYVSMHRADAIVADCECARATLLGADTKWTLLGQSFGGFCITRYLSVSSEGVREALYTGGLPPLIREANGAYETYAKLLARVKTQNEKYYARFPEDAERWRDIGSFVSDSKKIVTPAGSTFSLRGLQALGFSASVAGVRAAALPAETAWEGEGDDKCLSYAFLKAADDGARHEPLCQSTNIYCMAVAVTGPRRELRDFNDQNDGIFDATKALWKNTLGRFTSPARWCSCSRSPSWRLRSLKGIADALGAKTDWPRLYCADTLNVNDVPVACASYVEDAFVDWDLANATAAEIRGARVWATSEYMHSGVREDGARILRKLLELARDEDPLR